MTDNIESSCIIICAVNIIIKMCHGFFLWVKSKECDANIRYVNKSLPSSNSLFISQR